MATLTESGSKRPQFEVAGNIFFRCRCFFACDHNVVWLDSTGKRPGLGDLFQGTYCCIASSKDRHGETESEHHGFTM